MLKKITRNIKKGAGWFIWDIGKSEHSLPQQIGTLQTVINNLSEGVIVAGLDGRFLFFNPVAEKILGVGSQEITASQWTEVYGCFYQDLVTPYPSDQLPLARAIRGEAVTNEILFIKNPLKPDGVYISISASPMKDDENRLIGGIVIFRDITETILVEKLQEQSELRINAQFKGIPIPTYVWERRNDDFLLVDYNNAAHDITNGLARKLLGKKFTQVFKDSPRVLKDLTLCFQEKKVITREMPHRMRTTGEHKQVIFTYVYVPENLVLLHMQDITEMKKTEKELVKLSSAVEQTADSIVITDRHGVIEYVNPGFEATTGYTRIDAIGQTPRLLNSGKHDKKFFAHLWRTILSGQPFRGTIINKKKSGEFYWSQQTITPMKDQEGKISHYVSVLKDITEFKKRQEQEFNLQLAQEVQKNLYVNRENLTDYDLAGETYAADEANGDYFDFIRLADGSIGLVIGDVSGHGISAALIMAETRAFLRAFAKYEADPGNLLTMLNKELVADLDTVRFVTMILARIDPKRQILEYASAAHEPAYLLNGRGEVTKVLESQGIPLGFIKDYVYSKSEKISLEKEDTIVFLTDGVTEAHIDEENPFGSDRALEVVRKHRTKSSRQILGQLYEAVRDHTAGQEQQDDITAIICKLKNKRRSKLQSEPAGNLSRRKRDPEFAPISCLIESRALGLGCMHCERVLDEGEMA